MSHLPPFHLVFSSLGILCLSDCPYRHLSSANERVSLFRCGLYAGYLSTGTFSYPPFCSQSHTTLSFGYHYDVCYLFYFINEVLSYLIHRHHPIRSLSTHGHILHDLS